MIFDERDLEEQEDVEEMRKKHKPGNSQLDFTMLKKVDTDENMESEEKIADSEEEMLDTKAEEIEVKKESVKKVSKKSKPDVNSVLSAISELENTIAKKQEKEAKKLEKEEQKEVVEVKKERQFILDMNEKDSSSLLEQSSEENAFSDYKVDDDSDDELPYSEKDSMYQDEEGNFVKNISNVLHDSMIPYSEYVIMDRALPRVEDGLKPVQRRILYSMYELGVFPDKPYKKSAKTVGDVISNYHPHGDSSIYNAMVRLAQTFSMKEVLIDGHGNFGSVDGDSAAAMRYTEAKLAPLALEMLRDIDKDTVRWSMNYDDSKLEPDMLPGRFPNLLVNGATGIAVGLATNIPTHNLAETIDGCIAIIDNPNISLNEMMQFIKAPDFPTGGIILGLDEVKQAYETGKGKIIVRAKTHIEEEKGDKKTIVITEFPYQVNKASLLQKIVELKEKYKDVLNGISDIRDESDRFGTRAVVCLKKDVEPNKILNFLFKYTELQTTFGVNMVAIANGKPMQMGLLDILSYYVNYQREVVYKRTAFDLKTAKDRAHIVEGLLIAIKNIDEVIRIIKKSASVIEAKLELKSHFSLSEVQAQAILDMRLARLTNLEVTKLEQELAELEKTIKKLTQILNSKKLQMNVVKQEMLEIKKQFGSKRLTQIEEDSEKFNISEVEIKTVKDVYVCYSENNCLKVIPEKNFLISSRGISSTTTLNEVHPIILKALSNDNLLLFTNLGNCYKVNLEDIEECRWKDKGTALSDLFLEYPKEEKVISIFVVSAFPQGDLLCVLNDGTIRKSKWEEFNIKKQSFQYFKLEKDEKVVSVQTNEQDKTVLFVTKDGIALNADISDVSAQSRTASGFKGISLNDGDSCIYASLVSSADEILVVTDKSYSKKVKADQFAIMGRNRKGVKIISLETETGKSVVLAQKVEQTFEILGFDSKAKKIFTSTDKIALENRTSKGKPIAKNVKFTKVYLYKWL